MKSVAKRFFIPAAVIICIAITSSQPVYGGSEIKTVEKEQPPPEITITKEGEVTCVFDNTDIRLVIKHFSELTGQNFIIDNQVRGPVSVIAGTAFPIEDAINVLGSILEMRGYTLVPAGDFMKVMDKRSATRKSIPILQIGKNYEPADDDEMVTRIIDLKYLSSRKIIRDIKHSRFTGASIIEFPATNSLVIRDTSSNVDRMEALIKALDKPAVMVNGVKDLIMRYSQLTGKNIIIGEIGKKRVQIFNAHGLSDEELLNSMETIISTAGLKMEEQGNLIVIELDPEKSVPVIPPESKYLPEQRNQGESDSRQGT